MKKRRIKLLKIILIIILTLSLMFIASVYALLKEKISVVGKATLLEQPGEVQDYTVSYVVVDKWYSNKKYYSIINMTLNNNTDNVLNGWEIEISIPQNSKIINYSNTNCTVKSSTVLFENLVSNAQVMAKSSVTFQFQISASNNYYEPQNILLNGNPVGPPDGSGGNPDPIKQAQIEFIQDSSSKSGQYRYFQYTTIVKNTGNVQINSWEFELSEKDIVIEQIWNAILSSTSKISNLQYNGIIQPGGQVSFGFKLRTTKPSLNMQAINIVLN